MKYFENCKTIEDVRAEYKRLCKKLHPDLGGDTAEFQRMSADYEKAFNRCKNCHTAADGSTYYEESNETPEQFADIINILVTMDGLDIELCGRWLWIGGNTFAHKDELKAAGCWWAKKKKMWYWHLPEDKARGGSATMDEIRKKYGSQKIEDKNTVLSLA